MNNSNNLLNIFLFTKKRCITKKFIIYSNYVFCYNIKKLCFLKYKIGSFILISKYGDNNIRIIYFQIVINKSLYNMKNNYIIRPSIIVLY